eukprot:1160985-Pelagomonas_calceolata.AAC.5
MHACRWIHALAVNTTSALYAVHICHTKVEHPAGSILLRPFNSGRKATTTLFAQGSYIMASLWDKHQAHFSEHGFNVLLYEAGDFVPTTPGVPAALLVET